jgi:hypothetical protein
MDGPSHGNAVTIVDTHPANLADWLEYATGYTEGVPGFTVDCQTSGQPNYGGVTAPDAPCIFLALGSAGTITSFAYIDSNGKIVLQKGSITIQLDLADIPSGFSTNSSGNYVIKLREVSDCILVSGTPTAVYRQALVSEPYTTPLGNT